MLALLSLCLVEVMITLSFTPRLVADDYDFLGRRTSMAWRSITLLAFGLVKPDGTAVNVTAESESGSLSKGESCKKNVPRSFLDESLRFSMSRAS